MDLLGAFRCICTGCVGMWIYWVCKDVDFMGVLE